MDSFAQLMPELDREAPEPLSEQLYRQLRQLLLSGVLEPGLRLPATRQLARELSVSRNTVIAAYDQLSAEGYCRTRHGSGTFVSERLREPSEPAVRPWRDAADVRVTAAVRRARDAQVAAHFAMIGELPPVRHDFLYGKPDPRVVPLAEWRRAIHRRLRRPLRTLFEYGHPEGSARLREQIAAHVARHRGVHCDPGQVLVVAGTQQALSLCTRVLVEPGEPAMIEDPHYIGARDVLRGHGAELSPARVDAEGISVEPARAAGLHPRLIYITPSHQFPTGVVMSAPRRQQLVEFARACQTFVFEDDYDSEFRFEGREIPALWGMGGQSSVLYCGTFSKTLFPALRIGYLVAPEPLVQPLRVAKWLSDWSGSLLEQEVLAELMAEGDYERHLRRARHVYAQRREVLLECVTRELGARVTVGGENAGLHVVLYLSQELAQAEWEIATRARVLGVGVYPLSPHYLGQPRQGMLLGYSALDEAEIAEGIRRLGRAMEELEGAACLP